MGNPFWPWAIGRALKELRLELVWINGGYFFRTEMERDQVQKLAERYLIEKPGLPKTDEEKREARRRYWEAKATARARR